MTTKVLISIFGKNAYLVHRYGSVRRLSFGRGGMRNQTDSGSLADASVNYFASRSRLTEDAVGSGKSVIRFEPFNL